MEPSGSQKDSGWVNSQIAISSYENWKANTGYAWLQFLQLRDAALELLDYLPPLTTGTVDAEFGGQVATPTSSIYAMCPTPRRAYLRTGSAANKLQVAPGTLCQFVSGEFRAYKFAGTEEVTILGTGLNPRVDLLQMSLGAVDPETGSCALTLSVKTGTAAATPAYPAPDAGFCAIAGILVPSATGDAAGLSFGDDAAGIPIGLKVVHDQRMPLRVRTHATMPANFIYDTTNFRLDGGGEYVSKITATNGIALRIPFMGGTVGRLIDVASGVFVAGGAVIDARLSRCKWADTGGGVTVTTADVATADITQGVGANKYYFQHGGVLAFQSSGIFTGSPTPASVTANANGMGAPIWTNGRRCPFESQRLETPPVADRRLILRYLTTAGDNGSQWGPCDFYVAEGL